MRKPVRKSRRFEYGAHHKNRRKIRQNRKRKVYRFAYSRRKTFKYFYLFKRGDKKYRYKNKGNYQRHSLFPKPNNKTAQVVEIAVAISDGKKISKAAPLPALARRAITVVGKICMLVALIINSKICALLFFSVSKAFIALTAKGVAAPPIPKRLQETFIATFSIAVLFSVLKIFLATGVIIFDAARVIPAFSATFESPIQTA